MNQNDDDAALLALDEHFRRVLRRAARLKRNVDRDGTGWQRWSTSIDEALSIVDTIGRAPAEDLSGVSIKLDAVIWLLVHDGAILDADAQRRLQSLGREVRRLAARAVHEGGKSRSIPQTIGRPEPR